MLMKPTRALQGCGEGVSANLGDCPLTVTDTTTRRHKLDKQLPVTAQRGYVEMYICYCINQAVFSSFCPPALPLQPESQSNQNSDKSLGKDLLTPNDSAITDLSPKTDSSTKTETPTKTEASSKTDVRPSTLGDGSSPQPKKGRLVYYFCTVSVM